MAVFNPAAHPDAEDIVQMHMENRGQEPGLDTLRRNAQREMAEAALVTDDGNHFYPTPGPSPDRVDTISPTMSSTKTRKTSALRPKLSTPPTTTRWSYEDSERSLPRVPDKKDAYVDVDTDSDSSSDIL